jgi:hypothetical protein
VSVTQAATLRSQRFYTRRVDSGVCLRCRSVRDRKGAYCTGCTARLRDEKRAERDRWRQGGLCTTCGAGRDLEGVTCDSCRTRRRARHSRLKQKVMDGYGGCCACCGDTFLARLTIDHVNNDGAEHRRSLSNEAALYQQLLNRGFPEGFQVLCASCNLAKHVAGYCPH